MDNKRTGTLYCGKIWISKLYLKKFSRKKQTLFRWITHNFDARHHPLFVSPFHVHKRIFFLKKGQIATLFFLYLKATPTITSFRLLLYCIFSNNVVYDLHVNFCTLRPKIQKWKFEMTKEIIQKYSNENKNQKNSNFKIEQKIT